MRKMTLAVLLAAAGCSNASAASKTPAPAKEASFTARQEFTLTVKDGAKKLRAWLTMPQQDPNQTVIDFKVESPYPYRVEKDSEGNTFVYLFMGDFPTTKENEEKVRLTTGDGYQGVDKARVDYYFGNIDERRVTWSRGRDLTLSPKQDAGPVNSVAKAYVEVDGVSVDDGKGWTRKLTFTGRQ